MKKFNPLLLLGLTLFHVFHVSAMNNNSFLLSPAKMNEVIAHFPQSEQEKIENAIYYFKLSKAKISTIVAGQHIKLQLEPESTPYEAYIAEARNEDDSIIIDAKFRNPEQESYPVARNHFSLVFSPQQNTAVGDFRFDQNHYQMESREGYGFIGLYPHLHYDNG